jgi:DNA-binding NtrC family response regulator
MDQVLWIGPRAGPAALQELLGQQGARMEMFTSAESALKAVGSADVAVAIVTSDWPDAPKAIAVLTSARPDIKILAASDAGVPRTIVQCLSAGASGVLEFRSQSRQEIVQQIQEWVGRHRQSAKERELLVRLRELNEEFLKEVVAAQKRNLELEDKLKPEAESAAAHEAGPNSILIVDDEQVVHDVLTTLFSKKGWLHLSVMDGESAIGALKQQRFNLVVTDKNLPGVSGLEVLKAVKDTSPDTDVILMTGYASMDSAIDALNSGASAYLQKPFDDIRDVVKRIDGVLEKQKERSRKRHYLHVIKDRNREFLDRYRAIRADLETWLLSRGAGK